MPTDIRSEEEGDPGDRIRISARLCSHGEQVAPPGGTGRRPDPTDEGVSAARRSLTSIAGRRLFTV